MRCTPSGPVSASIAVVGEAPGANEEAAGLPFVGAAGFELDKMLREAGIERAACFITNVTHERPPDNEIEAWVVKRKTAPDSSFIHLRNRWVKPFIEVEHQRLLKELRTVNPNVVIAFGDTPLWALCPQSGIGKWRGSQLSSDAIPGLKVIPAYHPAYILRDYKERWITVNDLKRAKREATSPKLTRPNYSFGTKPSFREACDWLQDIKAQLDHGPLPLTCDLEIYHREVLCVGLGLSPTTAFCIPFLYTGGWYWTLSEHNVVLGHLRDVLTHTNALVINQNLAFDIQYLFWRFFMRPRAYYDTMLGQNVLFSGLPKDLAYQASMYNEYYVYWKDDGKFWEKFNDQELWDYNCVDCVTTFEIWQKQRAALEQLNLTEQMAFQMRTFENTMDMMLTGVKVREGQKGILLTELGNISMSLKNEVAYLCGMDLTGERDFSNQKIARFMYEVMRVKPYYNKEGRPTCDDETLKKIALKHPWLAPICHRINMVRSYKTAVDVCKKRTDPDGRWRTSYNTAGTTTYRLASSENPFDSGLNLQNLTLGRDILQ